MSVMWSLSLSHIPHLLVISLVSLSNVCAWCDYDWELISNDFDELSSWTTSGTVESIHSYRNCLDSSINSYQCMHLEGLSHWESSATTSVYYDPLRYSGLVFWFHIAARNTFGSCCRLQLHLVREDGSADEWSTTTWCTDSDYEFEAATLDPDIYESRLDITFIAENDVDCWIDELEVEGCPWPEFVGKPPTPQPTPRPTPRPTTPRPTPEPTTSAGGTYGNGYYGYYDSHDHDDPATSKTRNWSWSWTPTMTVTLIVLVAVLFIGTVCVLFCRERNKASLEEHDETWVNEPTVEACNGCMFCCRQKNKAFEPNDGVHDSEMAETQMNVSTNAQATNIVPAD